MAFQPKVTRDQWTEIEAEYSAGVKSLQAIAAPYGITEAAIRKRAKQCGWTRDLAIKIREATDNELLRRETRARIANGDHNDTVIVAAATRADIGEAQRRRIQRLTGIADKLVEQIAHIADTETIASYSEAVPAVHVLDKAARATGQLILLERTAWRMDEPQDTTVPVSAADELMRRLTNLVDSEDKP